MQEPSLLAIWVPACAGTFGKSEILGSTWLRPKFPLKAGTIEAVDPPPPSALRTPPPQAGENLVGLRCFEDLSCPCLSRASYRASARVWLFAKTGGTIPRIHPLASFRMSLARLRIVER